MEPDFLIETFGMIGILAIVFAESGLLIGFFLPGDSLLFTAGLLVADGTTARRCGCCCLLVSLAAIAGDQVGYLIGRKAGPARLQPARLAALQAGVRRQARSEFFDKLRRRGRSCWPASCRSCAPSPRRWPVSAA